MQASRDRETRVRWVLFVIVVLLAGNIEAMVDRVRHQEISYFDSEHLLVGGLTALMLILAFGVLEFYLMRRRLAEAALYQREVEFREAQRVAGVGSWVWEIGSDTITWSDELCHLLRYDRARPTPTFATLGSFYVPESWARLEKAVERALHAGEPYTLDLEMLRTDGTSLWTTTRGEVERDPKGQIVRLRGTVLDVNERKRAEMASRTSEAKLSQLFDDAPVGYHELDTAGRVVRVNRTELAMLGYAAEEMLGHAIWEYLEDRDRSRERVLGKLAGTVPPGEDVERVFRRKDGTGIPVIVHERFLQDDQGKITGIRTTVEDVTVRKAAEEANHEHELMRRLGLEVGLVFAQQSQPDALRECCEAVVAGLDAAFVRIWTLREGADVLELQASAGLYTHTDGPHRHVPVGQFMIGLIAAEKKPHLTNQVIGDPRVLNQEWAKQEGMVAFAGHPLIVDDRVVGVLAIFARHPLSELVLEGLGSIANEIASCIERKQAEAARTAIEARLQHAEKLATVGRLAGGVAHEFNNMLAVILGFTELSLRRVDAAQPLHADLLEIQKAAQRSADLTRQLLAYARKQTAQPIRLDLNDAVSNLLAMLRRLTGENIDITWTPESNLWPVMTDPSQLANVLTSLCLNARDSIADVGTIALATGNGTLDAAYCDMHAEAAPGDYVRLTVRDTGCGMDTATVAHLFEPFFTTKGVGKGTGLGLAAVYGIARQNGGFITVASVVGQGSTFELYLPRLVSAVKAAPMSGVAALDAHGDETILLVEDEPAVLRLTARALSLMGYVVLAASSPVEAMRLVREHPGDIHLLLSDVRMPGMSGRDLASAALAVRPTLKRLFMSGHTADVIASQGMLESGVAFIEKPYTIPALTATVREVLDGE